MSKRKRFPRWPMILLALPASVAIWGGWVGLGTLCGFGVVHPLPGLAGGFHMDLVLTLPVGVEAYGTYALAAWLWPGDIPARARRWAMYSALAALLLGCLGQVAYHLLMWSHAVRAPALVVVFVSCVPVAVVGAGGALYHLMDGEPDTSGDMAEVGPLPAAGTPLPVAIPGPLPEPPEPDVVQAELEALIDAATSNGHGLSRDEVEPFAAEVAAGTPPGVGRIREVLHCAQPRAQRVRDGLRALADARGGDR